MPEFVTVAVTGAVATLRVDRPPLNLLNVQAARELAAAAAEIARRPDVNAVVVSGGDKIFSAGDDITELDGFSDLATLAGDTQTALGCLSALPVPVVAAISCYALGSGLEVALAADRRVIGDNVKLAMPQVRAGLLPRGGGTQRLPALAGRAASELILTGRFVGADEARELGLVDEVVAPDEVYRAALAWAAQFGDYDRAALAAAKQALAGSYATERAQAAALLARRALPGGKGRVACHDR